MVDQGAMPKYMQQMLTNGSTISHYINIIIIADDGENPFYFEWMRDLIFRISIVTGLLFGELYELADTYPCENKATD